MPTGSQLGVMDLFLAIGAIATLVGLVRSWQAFWDDDFTFADRRIAFQIGAFVIPPVVVLFHELGHLYAARAVGAHVTSFHYGLFEGAVTATGLRTQADVWFMALAGNAVSVAFGLGMVWGALAARRMRRSLRYTLLVGGLLELLLSLVLYPVLSLTARFGDWILIYRTDGAPALAWVTGIVHVAALIGLWQWWRRRGKATLFAIGAGASVEAELAELQRRVQQQPDDPGGWLALADFYARRAELPLARGAIEDGLAASGDDPRLLLGLARLGMYQGRWNDAVVAARRGLEASSGTLDRHATAADVGDGVRQALWANLALALTQMDRLEHALDAYGHLTDPLAGDLRVRYGRGLVRMGSGDVEGGRADLRAVVDQLPERDLLRLWAEARLQGHPLTDWKDERDVPVYARRTAPPPAPLAGL